MKRIMKSILVAAVLAAVLAVSAFAADFTHCADALKDLGLFKGTSQGYELDRAPTRAEAGTMLVRLLGKEAEAKALTYTAPFNDVDNWAKPYVQYLYDNGLTKGVGNGKFGSNDLCTAQQYTTFLLRALGYEDGNGKDFTYAKAMTFAEEKGVVDAVNCDSANFLRDHVAAMSYTALSVAPKTGEADLLTKLVNDGAVKDAKGYDQKFQLFRDYCKVTAEKSEETNVAMVMDMDVKMAMAGIDAMTVKVKADIAAEMNTEKMDQSKMAYVMDMDMAMNPELASSMGVSADEAQMKATMNCYYTDGAFYMSMDGEKMKMPLSFEEAMTQVSTMDLENMAEPISMLKDISSTTSGGVQTYHVVYATGSFNSLMDTILQGMTGAEGVGDMAMEMNEMTLDVSVRGDALQSMDMSFGMNVTAEGMTMKMDAVCKVHDIKLGSDVKVTLPTDLATYPEM